MIGEYIQNYQVVAQLGEGGMGVVYKAVDNVLGREVALKMLHSAMIRQAQVLERFKKEAQVLARLLHPNIAVIYNFIEQNGQYFMVMEYVEGKNLDELGRAHSGLAYTSIAAMFVQALEGLHHAHKKGIFHRDIKPSNLILTPEGTIKLMDFGIAKIAGEQRLTQVNRVIGTVEFMAPEIIEGKEPSVASDIYATGITMYELLSGRLPFESNSDFNLMQDIMKKKPLQLKTINPNIPNALCQIVMKALEKKPEQRYGSAKEFQQALLSALPACRDEDLGALLMTSAQAYATREEAFTPQGEAKMTALAAGYSSGKNTGSPATVVQQLEQKVLLNKQLPYILTGAGLLAFLITWIAVSFNNKPVQLTDTKIVGAITTDTAKKVSGNQGGSIINTPEQQIKPVENIKPVTTTIPPEGTASTVEKSEKNKPAKKEAITKKKEETIAPQEEKKEPPPAPAPTPKPAEKKDVFIDAKLQVALRLRETIGRDEDEREQSITFSVSRPVVYAGVTIIKEGATARGSIKIGRVLSTVSITSVMAANGQEIVLREKDHRKIRDLSSDRDYTAVLPKGLRMSF